MSVTYIMVGNCIINSRFSRDAIVCGRLGDLKKFHRIAFFVISSYYIFLVSTCSPSSDCGDTAPSPDDFIRMRDAQRAIKGCYGYSSVAEKNKTVLIKSKF